MSSPQYTLDAPPADNAAAVEPNRQGLYLVMVDELNPNAGLFLGTQQAAQGATLLRQYGISKIVCVGTPAFHRRQEDDGFANSFVYLEIPVLDLPSENLLVHLDACASFIGDGMARGQSVLVNCVFAQSRSVAGQRTMPSRAPHYHCLCSIGVYIINSVYNRYSVVLSVAYTGWARPAARLTSELNCCSHFANFNLVFTPALE